MFLRVEAGVISERLGGNVHAIVVHRWYTSYLRELPLLIDYSLVSTIENQNFVLDFENCTKSFKIGCAPLLKQFNSSSDLVFNCLQTNGIAGHPSGINLRTIYTNNWSKATCDLNQFQILCDWSMIYKSMIIRISLRAIVNFVIEPTVNQFILVLYRWIKVLFSWTSMNHLNNHLSALHSVWLWKKKNQIIYSLCYPRGSKAILIISKRAKIIIKISWWFAHLCLWNNSLLHIIP